MSWVRGKNDSFKMFGMCLIFITSVVSSGAQSVGTVTTATHPSMSVTKLNDADLSFLMNAIEYNDLNGARKMLRSGLDLNVKDSRGFTPLTWAATHDQEDIAILILSFGADVKATDSDGNSPLMAAIIGGHKNMVDFLLKRNADPNTENARHWTPLDVARQGADETLVDLLVKAGAKNFHGTAMLPPTCQHPMDLAQCWAIATYRFLDELNNQHCFCLGGDDRSETKRMKDYLEKKWKIRNSENSMICLSELLNVGDRTKFEDLRKVEGQVRSADYDRVLHKYQDDRYLQYRFQIARDEGSRLGENGIIAWDLAGYIWLVNRIYAAGYMSEAEAWEKILPVSIRLQKTFRSWDEMADSYIVGWEFIHGSYRGANQKMKGLKTTLMDPDNANSPWINIPWDTPLNSMVAK